jgi:hypothetical protein
MKNPEPLTLKDCTGFAWCIIFSIIGGIGALLVIMVILNLFSWI